MVREDRTVHIDCKVVNENELKDIHKKLRKEADAMYENFSKEDEDAGFAHYYQLSHLINQLDKYIPLLDYSIDKK